MNADMFWKKFAWNQRNMNQVTGYGSIFQVLKLIKNGNVYGESEAARKLHIIL